MSQNTVSEVAVHEKEDVITKIVSMRAEGKNFSQIAKALDMTRPAVMDYWQLFKDAAVNSSNMKSRAREALATVDMHYDKLIAELYSVVSDIDDHAITEGVDAKFLGHKITAVAKIADLEAKRVQMLKEAGLLEDEEIARTILEQERKQEVVVGILRDVTSNCDHCRLRVAERLSEISNEPTVIKVVQSTSV